jgi:hypothetical protein
MRQKVRKEVKEKAPPARDAFHMKCRVCPKKMPKKGKRPEEVQ